MTDFDDAVTIAPPPWTERAVLVPRGVGHPVPLERSILLMGRDPACDVVVLASARVSRKHCVLVRTADTIMIRDLGSTNGTRVNGAREARVKLVDGDELHLGKLQLRITLPVEN